MNRVFPCNNIVRAAVLSTVAVLSLSLPSAKSAAHATFDNPAGTFEIPWSTDQLSATYATGVFNTLGLRVDNDPARARVVQRDGADILEGIALAFDLSDDYAFDIDRDAVVSIELDTDNLEEFFVSYDRNGGPDGLIRVDVPEKLSGFQTFKVKLERARFASRGFGGTDFAISSGIDMSNRLLSIRDIRFELKDRDRTFSAPGIVELIATEAGTDKRIAAQVGIYDASGRMPLPGPLAVKLQVFDQHTRLVEIREELDDLSWPHANRYSMYIDGFYRSSLPAGEYELVMTRGPEYEIVTRSFTVRTGETTRIETGLKHSLDMPARGWYSGDVHNHFSRPSSAANSMHMAHARAQDLHLHWLNELGNSTDTHFTQYAWGEEGQYREQDYFLASAQEDPRTDYLGHVLSLGQNQRVRRANDYLRYDLAVADIHQAEGIAGIAHMDFAQFWQDVALALLVADEAVDFVEIMQFNSIHGKDWYRFLNMGFELPAAAGSDWPYMALPGSVRTYAKVEGEFTPESWKQALRDGRTFVSNGPMLSLSVNGEDMGSRVKAKAGDIVKITASAEIEPSRDLLARLDVIVGGEIVASVVPDAPQQALSIDYELVVEHGSWVAVQAHGVKSKDIVFQGDYTMRNIAHSSPVYVEVDGFTAAKESAVLAMDHVIERLQWFKTAQYARNDNEIWESPERTAELVDLQRESVNVWVDRIIAWYQARQAQLRADMQ
ncbi:MAG: CehA/McbA family metallohydrolase [Pseudomonadales bacterium]